MKKTFLKATLFSLMLGALPATMLTGCKDYDDDIDRLTQRDDAMQKEINDKLAQQDEALKNQVAALQKALDEQKAEAARANDAAAKAATAAAEAQKTGDKALAEAQKANTEALAAQAAAAQAKADAIAEAIRQTDALRTEIASQISALQKEYGEKYDQVAAAVAQAATKQDLNDAVSTLQAAIEASRLTKADVEAMLADQISQLNENTQKISALSGKVDGISTQYNTLSTDLGNVKNDVETNKNDIAANAINIAQEAGRINKIIGEMLPGIDTRITTLDTELAGHLSAYNTFQTQTESQLTALEEFQGKYEELLSGLGTDLGDIKDRLTKAEEGLKNAQDMIKQHTVQISNANDLISQLQNKDADHDQAITDLQAELTTVNQDIAAINSALSTLNAINAKRLTSLTLIPKAYVGGIPTIEFYSASYVPMGAFDTATGFYAPAAADAAPVIVTNNDTQVLYRMNPAGVTIADIVPGEVSFVQMTATSRAAETPVVKVVAVNKDEETGNLVVTATKADGVTGSIDNAGAGKIYTVALRVPIAEKNYYTLPDGNKESAEDAVVYSEYSRLSESTFTPEIAWNKEYAEGEAIEHFWGQDLWTATDAAPVKQVSYTVKEGETVDLSELVTGCMSDNGKHTLMTADQLASFGFSFEFSVPAKAYEVDGVNQQEFADVTKDGGLTPVQPEALTAASRVGKTPIISVVMKKGDQVIDQKFFKIEYVISAEATDYTIELPAKDLSCDEYIETVTWKMFNEQIISKLPFEMNQAEFISTYTTWTVSNEYRIYVDISTDKDQPLRLRGPLKDLANMNGENKNLEQSVTFKSSVDGFPEIKVTLKGTVLWPANLPTLGNTLGAYWNNGVMEVMPEAMPVPYDNSTATYKTNIFAGRTAPYLNGLLPCAAWDVQIKSINNGFAAGAEAPVSEGNDGYNVVDGEEVAASIWYEADDHTPFSLDGEDAATESKMFFYINNNAAGIKLVDQKETASVVSLGWYVYLNGVEYKNNYALYNTDLRVIAPLKSVNLAENLWVEQNTTVQYLELADGMTITDCFNNTFDNTSDYWKYYVIEPGEDEAQKKITWNNDIKVSEVVNPTEADLYPLSTYEMEAVIDADGKLAFTGSGIKLQKSLYLNINVTVPHKWGTLDRTVQVEIKPNGQK